MKSKKVIVLELLIIVIIAIATALGLPLYKKQRLQSAFYDAISKIEDDGERENTATLYYNRGYLFWNQKEELAK